MQISPNITAILKADGKLYARAEDFNQDLFFFNHIPEKLTGGMLAEVVRNTGGLIQVTFINLYEVEQEARFKEDGFIIPRAGEALFMKQASRVASIFGTLPEVDNLFLELGANDARKIRNKKK